MARKKAKKELDWLDEPQEEIIWVSKSEIKRDAEQLKQLGEKLTQLTAPNLGKIPLPENILEAVQLAQRLQKEARRRQLQYIGKLLRNTEVEPIQEALDKLENKHQQQQALFHKLEQWRDDLVSRGDQALDQLLTDYPKLDRQQLRHLVRSAQKEQAQNKPPKAYREIYQILKQTLVEEP